VDLRLGDASRPCFPARRLGPVPPPKLYMLNMLVGADVCIVNTWAECCSSHCDVVQMRRLDSLERTCMRKGRNLAKRIRSIKSVKLTTAIHTSRSGKYATSATLNSITSPRFCSKVDLL
jgi:hypothetical protein